MNKKERMEAVFNMQTPDVMPVFPRVMAQAIFDMGWSLPDISTQTTMDADKVAEAFISNIKKYDYDLCFGTYMDHGFGVPTLGGVLNIPEKFGVSVSIKVPPIQKREDWADVKKKLPDLKGLLSLVADGTEVVLTEDNTPIARLVPISKRIAGLHSGAIWMSEDFDEPLPDEFWTDNA